MSFEGEGRRDFEGSCSEVSSEPCEPRFAMSNHAVEQNSKVEDTLSEVYSEMWDVRYIGCLRLT